MVSLALIALTCSILAAFGTKAFIDSRSSSDPCAEVVGQLRLRMSQSKVPSVFDEKSWDELTDKYNQVFENCDPDTANKFAIEEFDPWTAPALTAFEAPAQAEPATSTTSTAPETVPETVPDTATAPSIEASTEPAAPAVPTTSND
jgi:hypothetical protein